MTKKERYKGIIEWFRENMQIAETELHYENPYQLLMAVILSAQCTDKRVNQISPALFEAYPTPEVMAVSTPEAVYEYVKSVSYPNSKAKHLVEMSQMLNVMQSVVWGKATMAVDTHVFRVSHRLGLVPESCNTPLKVELELVKHIADEDIPKAHHWLLLHGRYICQSRTPHCEKCGLQPWCKHFLGNTF